MKKIKLWFWNLFIALDQFLNAFLGGYPDETFSSRTYRKALAGQWFWLFLAGVINLIFFCQENHCRASYQEELAKNHGPQEIRGNN